MTKYFILFLCIWSADSLRADAPRTPEVHTHSVISNATDLVIKAFTASSGQERGQPILRIDATVVLPLGGSDVGLVIDKTLETDTDVYYLLRPKRVRAADGVNVVRNVHADFSYSVPQVQWSKSYHFTILNFTGGLSARHSSIYTYAVAMFRPTEPR